VKFCHSAPSPILVSLPKKQGLFHQISQASSYLPFSVALTTVLARVTGISLKSTGTTTLYTVPAGLSTRIISAVVSPTTATTASGDAVVSIGVGGTFDNIIAATTLTGLDATTENFTMEVGGISHTGAATEVITFEVDTIDSGSALTVTVDLLGYLS